ncbi:MAG TPA: class I SAM-dependent methyltransferase, partial [Vicinamibacterales bacterium]|nr:class I SAM-dependent methyltransferase [Vicinamibacterales bacterium]
MTTSRPDHNTADVQAVASAREQRRRAAAVYNAAADTYDAAENAFWRRFGRRTIERLPLEPGMRVLDVCAGSGASVIPAATAVGPSGCVLAIDAARDLLSLVPRKARAEGLGNIHIAA